MFTYLVDHSSNVYYSTVMDMRTILCLRQGIDKPTEAYYRIFEAAISTAELEKFNVITHMELNKVYANGEDEYITKRFQ